MKNLYLVWSGNFVVKKSLMKGVVPFRDSCSGKLVSEGERRNKQGITKIIYIYNEYVRRDEWNERVCNESHDIGPESQGFFACVVVQLSCDVFYYTSSNTPSTGGASGASCLCNRN